MARLSRRGGPRGPSPIYKKRFVSIGVTVASSTPAVLGKIVMAETGTIVSKVMISAVPSLTIVSVDTIISDPRSHFLRKLNFSSINGFNVSLMVRSIVFRRQEFLFIVDVLRQPMHHLILRQLM